MHPSGAASPTTDRVPSWLVGIDGSPESDAALRGCVGIAKRAGLRLTALSVSEDLADRPSMYMLSTGTARTLQRELDEHARTLLDAVTAAVADGISIARCFRRGVPAEAILAEIEEGGHDAVILGARGVGASTQQLGSVTRHVLARARVPVVVVPSAPRGPDGAPSLIAHAGLEPGA